MPTFLFDKIIFGPVRSRRLGVSLGINLLPVNKKYCNFNCIYCECGWSHLHKVGAEDIPSRGQVRDALALKLAEMTEAGQKPDVITFAGNGEPTMHLDFPGIIDDSLAIRDKFCPDAEIAVLTNSSLIHKASIAKALAKADQNILKLDTVNQDTFKALNCPSAGMDIDIIIKNLTEMPGRKIIQSLFTRGMYKGIYVDNTSEAEIRGLVDACKKINPVKIMVYTFARDTAAAGLERIPAAELNQISEMIEKAGFTVEVSG